MPPIPTRHRLTLGDCRTVDLPKVDLILVDPPYGITDNAWDKALPCEEFWRVCHKAARPDTPIVVFCSQPFTSVLIVSNRKQYRYLWYWNKVNRITGFLDSKKRPLKMVEELAVFYAKQPVYNPQMVEGVPYTTTSGKGSKNWGKQAVSQGRTVSDGQRYPQHLLAIKGDERGTVGRLHPTQKPIALLEYMIRTYTKPGHTVLDFCMGVGSTGVAARRTGRHFIGIEQDPDYFTIAKRRIERYKEDKPSA